MIPYAESYSQILAYVRTHSRTHGLKISRELGIPHTTANRVVNQLHQEGIIHLIWSPKHGKIKFIEYRA